MGVDDNEFLRPEGALIEEVLASLGWSMRRAAKEVGISDSRLRHIVRGYQPVGREQRIEVVAPAATLAEIALALKIAPDDMKAAGRDDAAEIMQTRLRPMSRWSTEAAGVYKRWAELRRRRPEITEWLQSSGERPPVSAMLEYFSDEQLLAEVSARMGAAGATAREDARRRAGSVRDLSVVAPKTDDAVAAHEEEGSIAEEQEQTTEP